MELSHFSSCSSMTSDVALGATMGSTNADFSAASVTTLNVDLNDFSLTASLPTAPSPSMSHATISHPPTLSNLSSNTLSSLLLPQLLAGTSQNNLWAQQTLTMMMMMLDSPVLYNNHSSLLQDSASALDGDLFLHSTDETNTFGLNSHDSSAFSSQQEPAATIHTVNQSPRLGQLGHLGQLLQLQQHSTCKTTAIAPSLTLSAAPNCINPRALLIERQPTPPPLFSSQHTFQSSSTSQDSLNTSLVSLKQSTTTKSVYPTPVSSPRPAISLKKDFEQEEKIEPPVQPRISTRRASTTSTGSSRRSRVQTDDDDEAIEDIDEEQEAEDELEDADEDDEDVSSSSSSSRNNKQKESPKQQVPVMINGFPASHNTRWTAQEKRLLLAGINQCGYGHWKQISTVVGTRNARQVKNHARDLVRKGDIKVTRSTEKGRQIVKVDLKGLIKSIDVATQQEAETAAAQASLAAREGLGIRNSTANTGNMVTASSSTDKPASTNKNNRTTSLRSISETSRSVPSKRYRDHSPAPSESEENSDEEIEVTDASSTESVTQPPTPPRGNGRNARRSSVTSPPRTSSSLTSQNGNNKPSTAIAVPITIPRTKMTRRASRLFTASDLSMDTLVETSTISLPPLPRISLSDLSPTELHPLEILHQQEWFHPITTPRNAHKTATRYLKIRNYILSAWEKSKPDYLTKTSCRPGLRGEGDVNAIGRVHEFLESVGAINYSGDNGTKRDDRKMYELLEPESDIDWRGLLHLLPPSSYDGHVASDIITASGVNDTKAADQSTEQEQLRPNKRRRISETIVQHSTSLTKSGLNVNPGRLIPPRCASAALALNLGSLSPSSSSSSSGSSPPRLSPGSPSTSSSSSSSSLNSISLRAVIDSSAMALIDFSAHLFNDDIGGLLGGKLPSTNDSGSSSPSQSSNKIHISSVVPCNLMDPVSLSDALLQLDGCDVVGFYVSRGKSGGHPWLTVGEIEQYKQVALNLGVDLGKFVGVVVSPYDDSVVSWRSRVSVITLPNEEAPVYISSLSNTEHENALLEYYMPSALHFIVNSTPISAQTTSQMEQFTRLLLNRHDMQSIYEPLGVSRLEKCRISLGLWNGNKGISIDKILSRSR